MTKKQRRKMFEKKLAKLQEKQYKSVKPLEEKVDRLKQQSDTAFIRWQTAWDKYKALEATTVEDFIKKYRKLAEEYKDVLTKKERQ